MHAQHVGCLEQRTNALQTSSKLYKACTPHTLPTRSSPQHTLGRPLSSARIRKKMQQVLGCHGIRTCGHCVHHGLDDCVGGGKRGATEQGGTDNTRKPRRQTDNT
jgi:hypothetical protein